MKKVVVATQEWGDWVRYYTVDYRKQKTEEKYTGVSELLEKVETVQKKWRSYLYSNSSNLKQICATMVELVYQTCGRIGTDVYALRATNPSYGISTLTPKHIKISSNKMILDYIGKKGVRQKHTVLGNTKETKRLIQLVKELMEGKGPNDFIFTYKGKHVTGTLVNKFLKGMGSPVTIHKIRTLRGTKLAENLLAKKTFKKDVSEAEVNKWVKAEMTKVGQLLGHFSGEKVTPATAIRSYINPIVFEEFYSRLGLRPPKFIQQVIKDSKSE